jgi:ATP-dependent protease ClpP protease subunit
MSRIEIRGIIVPSDYDGGWFAEYIERGVITPESKFRNDLKAAPTNEPLAVYVNSPGGSVYAGNEMINSALAWKRETGQNVNVVLGAMAASMGAAFTIGVADSVTVHQNSLLMFHGAFGVQIGGSESMKDYAEVLDKINANIQSILLSRYELQPEQVKDWFAEGREGWLDATDMKTAGIAQEVISVEDDALDLSGVDLEEFDKRGLKIAALAEGLADLKAKQEAGNVDGTTAAQSGERGETDNADTQEGSDERQEDGGEDGQRSEAEGESVPEQESGDEQGSGTAGESLPAGSEEIELSAERLTGREEGRAKALAEMQAQLADLEARTEKAEADSRRMQSERDSVQAELKKKESEHEESLAALREELRLSNERHTKLLDGALTFSAGPADWTEAMELCRGDYEKCAKEYPELKKRFQAEKSQK